MSTSPATIPVETTQMASYTEAISRALEAAGANPAEVFRDAQVQHVRRVDPLQRISDSDISAIYQRAVEVTGDTYFGLRVGESMAPGMLHALGYALLASETLEEFCNRAVRYWGVAAQSADFSVSDDGAILRLEAKPKNPQVCFETQDAYVALILRLMRMAYRDDLQPLSVELKRPQSEAGHEPYREIFDCPLLYGQDSINLYFDLATMRQPLPAASRELAQHNDQVMMHYLEKLDRDDIVSRVRANIVTGLKSGSFSRIQIAASVCMSVSTLRIKLGRAGLSFQQLLDETRHELALGYIEQSGLSITEIAFTLGFSDLSNFIRAFKRWTGKSPTEFRKYEQ